MRLQIWYFEDIENILWAAQTVGQAGITVLMGNGRPAAYQPGFKRGFEIALQRTAKFLTGKSLSQEIWSREQILSMLRATQAVMQANTKILTDQLETTVYRQGFNQGFEVALWCAATAFGVSLLSIGNETVPKRAPGIPLNPDPWFQEDIQNILLAMNIIMQDIMGTSDQLAPPLAYNDGFETALQHVAKSFGIRLLLADVPVSAKDTGYWLRQDIKHKLYIAYQTIPITKVSTKHNVEFMAYCQGFKAMLQGVSTSFGINEVI